MNDSSDTEEINLAEARYMVERRKRLRVVMIVLPMLLGLLLGLWTTSLSEEYFRYELGLRKEALLLMVVSMLGLSGLAAVMSYLQTGYKTSPSAELETMIVRKEAERLKQYQAQKATELHDVFKDELAGLRQKVERTKDLAANIGQPKRDELVLELQQRIVHQSSDSILAEIRQEISKRLERESNEHGLFAQFEESRLRLSKELEALGRRGNLNLALGAVTTVIGLVLLGASVFSELTEINDLWSFTSHFLPRLTLVLLIELFAYFFLSLYKTSLVEIKYFQNELTNVESKQISLQAAIAFAEPTTITAIVSKIAETERNHILTKDQTTVELEKAKIEKDSRADLGKVLAEFFQKKA